MIFWLDSIWLNAFSWRSFSRLSCKWQMPFEIEFGWERAETVRYVSNQILRMWLVYPLAYPSSISIIIWFQITFYSLITVNENHGLGKIIGESRMDYFDVYWFCNHIFDMWNYFVQRWSTTNDEPTAFIRFSSNFWRLCYFVLVNSYILSHFMLFFQSLFRFSCFPFFKSKPATWWLHFLDQLA